MATNKISLGMILVAVAVLAFVVAIVLVYTDPAKHADTIQELTLGGLCFGFVGVKLA